MCRCLFCYKELPEGQTDFHSSCVKRFFGTRVVPRIDYRHKELDLLAEQVIRAQTSLTGVQPKLSLNLQKHEDTARLTIVGLWGDYIFKPQTEIYPEFPENEDLTMHLAEAANINVVPHSLIRMADGRLGYVTKRIDRTDDGRKIDMEDMCQITFHPTEYKYKGSHEQIAKAIVQHCATPKLDLVNYMQIVLFCFVTGNNNMHLKNFSLYRRKNDYQLTPAYDLLNVAIANPSDKDELALSLDGRKSRLTLNNFIQAGRTMGIDEIVIRRLIVNFKKALPKWMELIRASFLSNDMKTEYENLIAERLKRLE